MTNEGNSKNLNGHYEIGIGIDDAFDHLLYKADDRGRFQNSHGH
jgi:hypothetical protein